MSFLFYSQRIKTLYLLLITSLIVSACNQASQNVTPTEFAAEITVEETATSLPVSDGSDKVFLSIEENGYAHLFIYHPQ
ncbi:MAG: hypothetical protein ACK40V_10345, partial [Anaerolineales bacterium]